MQALKKIIIFALSVIVLFNAFAANSFAFEPSDWAKSEVSDAISNSLLPDVLQDKDYTKAITRGEFCYMVINLYKALSKNDDIYFGSSGFADTFDLTYCAAAELGIMKGRDDNCFYPNDNITRQEMASVICRTLSVCGIDVSLSLETSVIFLSGFYDSIEIYPWAYNNFGYCLSNGLIKGTSDTTVSPNAPTSVEQAIVIINRCFKNYLSNSSYTPPAFSQDEYNLLSCNVSGDISFVSFYDRALTISYPAVDAAVVYKTNVFLSADNFWYTDTDTYVKTLDTNEPQTTLTNMRAGKRYNITVLALDSEENVLKVYYGTAFPESLYTLEEKEAIIFGSGEIDSKQSADVQMQTITVKVWAVDLQSNKYSSSMSLSVHKNIAQIVTRIFEEIYNGEEKFAFKDIGAYFWRDTMSSGRYSHHNYGTAIDINSNENYCLYKNGTFVGKYYKPYEDLYSIPADSEVVSIFAKYGFVWGGDEWSNPKDYMHFSYLEL